MESRVTVLRAVAEALFPAAEASAAEAAVLHNTAEAAFYRHNGASDQVIYKVIETIETRLTPEARRELYLLLRLLASRLGCLIVLGRNSFSSRFGLPTAFPSLPCQQREAVLQSWYSSADANMRKAFKGLKSLIMSAQFTQLTPDGTSDLLAAMRYPITDPLRPPAPAPAATAAEAAVASALVDLSGADGSPGSAAGAGAALAAKGLRVEWPGDYGSAAVARERPQLAVRCDVVVVGSGAGGGVAAANLAAAGLKVVVLEKSSFMPAGEMTLEEGQAFQAMYEQGGILSTEDASLSVLAGSTLGGGTRVNWCASFTTAPHVRKEWAEQHGLPDFASPKYDEAQEAVCRRLSVHTGFNHGTMCSILRSGLDAQGIHSEDVPRNCLTPDCGGHCCLGCARGYKQDSVNTWLADACQAGARIITGAWAERLILEPNSGGETVPEGGHERPRRTAGVLAFAGSAAAPLRLAIVAPVVVSAAGSLHSPALLLRSGVSCKGAVGSNLRLHPCSCVVGLFPSGVTRQQDHQEQQGQQQWPAGQSGPVIADMEDLGAAREASRHPHQQHQNQQQQQQQQEPLNGGVGVERSPSSCQAGGSVRSWEGPIMSVFSKHAGDWEGSGYGCLLYNPAVHPGLFAAAAPWINGEDYKQLMLCYPDACIVLVLVRDQDAGRITVDKSGRPRIHYTLSKRDQASMVKGVELGLRCMAAAGAQSVMTLHNSPAGRFTFTQQPASTQAPAAVAPLPGSAAGGTPEFEAFLAGVAQTGIPPLAMPQFSAHQMGTCRLGGDPKQSVLDPAGECWDVEGLYCLDGSSFPTPTGLNPMISIEAISFMLSKQLAARLAARLAAGDIGRKKGGRRSAKL